MVNECLSIVVRTLEKSVVNECLSIVVHTLEKSVVNNVCQ